MGKKASWKGKKQYASYKTENRVYKNKVKKLERHCKRFPDDEQSKKHLERVKKDGYTGRSKPLVPGSNPTERTPKYRPIPGYFLHYPKTPGEQLSELLGIPLPKRTPRRSKPKRAVIKKKGRKK